MRMHRYLLPAALLSASFTAQAGTEIGTFCWRLEPLDDVVCLDVEQNADSFSLTGVVASNTARSAVPAFGSAAADPFDDDAVLVSLDLTGLPFVAVIETGNFSGSWEDGNQDGGDLVFLGPATGVEAARSLSGKQHAGGRARSKFYRLREALRP